MNSTILSYSILGLSVCSHLLPLIMGKRKNNVLLWYFIIAAFLFEIILITLKRIVHVQTIDYHIIGGTFFLVEFYVLTFYYYKRVIKHRKYIIPLFVIATLLYLFTFYKGTAVSGKGEGLFILLFSFYSITGLYTQLKNLPDLKIEKSQFFWVNAGILIYSAGSLPIFIAVDTLLSVDKATLYSLWVFRNILNVIKNIIFAKALSLKENE